MNKGKDFLSEFIGTFLLVFIGTGAILVSETTKKFGHMGVAFAFGVIVMILIYSFEHVSVAHFNPAVSIGFYVSRDINLEKMILYCIAQVTGAICASFVILILFGNQANLGATLPSQGWEQAFILEMILTGILMLVILMCSSHGKANKSFAGIAIGATVAIEALVFGPMCGASMNPARSIGPAVIGGASQYIGVYIIAQILGSIISVLLYKAIFFKEHEINLEVMSAK